MRPIRFVLLAVLLLLPTVVWGQAAAVLDLSHAQPGKTYFYSVVVGPGGEVQINKIQLVVPVNGDAPVPIPEPGPITPLPPVNPPVTPPPPQPQPTPAPPSEKLEVRIQQLTQQAIENGGSVTSAVGLQRAYNLVAASVEAGQLEQSKVFEVLRLGTDVVLDQTGERGKWSGWRESVSQLIATEQARGVLNTREEHVALLRRIENGIKNTINTLGVADPSLQDKINYDAILKLQQRIIEQLKTTARK